VSFAFSTVERWLYVARRASVRADTVGALRRRVRKDAGQRRAVSSSLIAVLLVQYRDHTSWSYQLHADNLVALALLEPALGRVPSYSTVRRFMKERGLFRQKKRRRGGERASDVRGRASFDSRETRSFESEYVHGLWHLDFHTASRKIVLPSGELVTPELLGVLDDRSRLCCHLQWYLVENAENLIHGLSQAIQKRGLFRALLSDNGGAMLAGETTEGLARLGVEHATTLPACPEQNGKQESFWGQVEGRLLAMLENVPDLTLDALNHATQAWVEMEYNRAVHSEIHETPTERCLRGPHVGRDSPSADELRHAFRVEETRTQRRSDGTVSIEGVRFEVPARYRHMERLSIRYASWDLGRVHIVDARTGKLLAPLHPLDRTKNSDGLRRVLEAVAGGDPETPMPKKTGMAPLLRQLITAYDRNGLPPAYLPKDERVPDEVGADDDNNNTENS
jgi:transposase InsO family protein